MKEYDYRPSQAEIEAAREDRRKTMEELFHNTRVLSSGAIVGGRFPPVVTSTEGNIIIKGRLKRK